MQRIRQKCSCEREIREDDREAREVILKVEDESNRGGGIVNSAGEEKIHRRRRYHQLFRYRGR